VVVGPRRDDEVLAGGGDRSGDARGRFLHGTEAGAVPVLDRDPGETRAARERHGLRHAGVVRAVAVLQVGGHGQRRRARDGSCVVEHLLARGVAVEAAERRGVAAARRGQRLEAEARENAGRAGVPRVRRHQGAPGAVQVEEGHR